MVSYQIYFRKGEPDEVIYTVGDNVSVLEITNSDDQYYQSGFVELFDVPDIYDINDKVTVSINGVYQFSGYINRKEQRIELGVTFTRYQIIGETYDLWRYSTDDYAMYSGMTCYIASSLISSYCENIGFYDYNPDLGYNIVNDIDLKNIPVGDAITRLTELDGCNFYVQSGLVHYYKKYTSNLASFDLDDSDIIESDFIGQSDEDLVNDCMVIGGTGYSAITNSSPNGDSYGVFQKNMLIAQKFTAEDDILAGVRPYLNRTYAPNDPSQLLFEIWESTEKRIFKDTFDSWKYLDLNTNNNMDISGSYLCLSKDLPHVYFIPNGTVSNTYSAIVGAPTAHEAVDDPVGYPDETTYLQGYSGGDRNAIFSIPTYAGVGQIAKVTVHVRGYTGGGYDRYIYCGIKIGSTTYWQVFTFNLGWNTYSYDWTVNPSTNQPWTWNDINSLQIGCRSSVASWNNYITQVYMEINRGVEETTSFPYIGQIETYCFSGQYKNEQSGYDCQYMIVQPEGMISSQKIYISGSHDSGATWVSLTPDTWVDFGHVDHSVKLKYKFSSNGAYSPKIDTCSVRIADATGGFESLLYNDTFSNYTYISTASITADKKVKVEGGYLQLSGNSNTTLTYADDATNYGTWTSWTNSYDHNVDTYAYTGYGDGGISAIVDFKFTTPIDFYAGWVKFGYYGGTGDGAAKGNDMWVSGLKTNGWVLVRDADWYNYTVGWTPPGGNIGNGPIPGDQTYPYFVDIKQVRYSLTVWRDAGNVRMYLYEGQAYDFNKITWSGSVKTSSMTSTNDIYYLKPVLTGYHTDLVFLSGSCDSGAHWKKLTNNTKTLISYPGKKVVLQFNFRPWTTFGSTIPNTPKIDTAKLYGYTTKGGGLPKSGTSLEQSKLNFYTSDLEYPPSYSAWKTYSLPKLRVNDEQDYWMVFQGASGSTGQIGKYWSFCYDPSSTNNGIAYSWAKVGAGNGIGVKWSSSIMLPLLVPAGDMRFKLGWKEGEIKATSINQDSIDLYGRHFKKISDSNITTLEQAQARADLEVSGMTSIPKQGIFTIDGKTSISTEYLFSANLENSGINEKFDVKSYTQRIDNKGFTTKIVFGKHEFDLAQKIAQLEKENES